MSEGLYLAPAISAAVVPTPPAPLYTLFYNADDGAIPTLKAHTTGTLIPLGGLSTEAAQDIVGAMALDSATIDFTYDDGAGTLTAIVKPGSIGTAQLDFDPATQAELDIVSAAVAAHISNGTGAHAASAISYGGNAGLSSVNVEAALDELDNEKQPIDADLTSIAGLDSSTAGAIASDGAGWIKKTYAQFKTALGLVKADVGLGSVDNVQQLPLSYLDTDVALAANSDTKVASQKATKAYIDQIVAAQDAMVFKGVIDASSNPNYPAADRGHTYRISVAGKIGGASGVNVEAGDLILCLTDGTAAGTQAGVGANWTISQTNIDGAVTGAVSSTDNDIALFNGTSGKVIKDSGVTISTDGAFTSNSNSKVPTEQAAKTYADTKQPGDADLTAIAALTTTAYGRSQLTLADATADTAQLNLVTTSLKGLMSAADKIKLNGIWIDVVAEYGADPTGAVAANTAITNAMAALPSTGGVIYFPAGTFLINAQISVTKPIIFKGAGRSISVLSTNQATADVFDLQTGSAGTGWEQLRISATSSSLRTGGFAIDMNAIANAYVQQCDILFQHSSVHSGGALQFIDDANIREGGANAASGQFVKVDGTGDRYFRRITTDNPSDPTGFAGIRALECSSMVISDSNIINSTNCLDVVPNAGGGHQVASILSINTFYDSSVNGVNIVPATNNDSVNRVRFINCWFSTMTGNGVTLGSASINVANVNSVDFLGCDFYQNVVGLDSLGVAEWAVRGSRFAGNTTAGIRTAQGLQASVHAFTIADNVIGNVAGFGANGVGINIQAGTYKRYQILDNRGLETNTTPGLTDSGTVAAADQKNVSNNMGAMISGLSAANITSPVLTTGDTVIIKMPIPANSLQIGGTIRAVIFAQLSAAATPSFRLRLGTAGTTADAALVTHAPVLAAAGRTKVEILFTPRTLGAGGTSGCVANNVTVGLAPTATNSTQTEATPAINTTAINFLSLTASATAGNLTIHSAIIEVLG